MKPLPGHRRDDHRLTVTMPRALLDAVGQAAATQFQAPSAFARTALLNAVKALGVEVAHPEPFTRQSPTRRVEREAAQPAA